MSQGENKMVFYGQLLVIASLPFHFLISSYAIGLLLLAFIFQFFKSASFRKKTWASFSSNRIAQLLALGFIVYVSSVLIHYSSYTNSNIPSAAIEKKLSFLIFPFLLSNIKYYTSHQTKILFKTYFISILASSLIALMVGVYYTISTGSLYFYSADTAVVYNNFMYHRLGSYVGIHAVYFAEYVLLAFIICVSYSYYNFSTWNFKTKFLSILLGAYLIAIIFLLKSAAILLILLVIISLMIVYHLYKSKDHISRSSKIIIAIVGLLLVGTLSYRAIDKIGSKASFFSYDISQPGGGEWNAINLRIAKWHVAKQAIAEHWALGVGPGNTISTLDYYYKKAGFDYALQLHYNPHNQFLHTFLTVGVLGVSLLITIFTISLIQAIKKKDSIMMLFIISFMLFSMSESTLAVNKGIVFFTLFLSLFSYLPKKTSDYLYEQNIR